VAQALLHDPPVVILDEPTDGLDPNQKYEMRKIIAAMQPEKAIIISTHLLEEVEAVCSRAIIIAHGRILADGTPTQLAERSRHHKAVRLGVASGTQSQICAELARLPGVAAVEAVNDSEGDALMIFPGGDAPVVAKVADLARAHGWEVTGLRVERGRLDDVFREITTVPPESAPISAAA
jgi:ABC-2 type transport system ATP-binding protein